MYLSGPGLHLSINDSNKKQSEKILHFYSVKFHFMLKKLKSLFIIEEEGKSEVARDNKSESTTPLDASAPSNVNNTSGIKDYTPGISGGTPDPKFVDVLLKAIESANKEGFDYLEYKTSLQSLLKMEMDEATRFKSAYVMARTLGLTKEKLVQSAQFYIDILKNEEKKFKDALINQRDKQVKGRELDLKNIEKTVADKQAAIEKLKSEIESANNELIKVRQEINEAVQKIDSTNEQFMVALHSVMDQITEDKNKIQSYLE